MLRFRQCTSVEEVVFYMALTAPTFYNIDTIFKLVKDLYFIYKYSIGHGKYDGKVDLEPWAAFLILCSAPKRSL